jgi:hemerythrin-like domain-containing protein
MVITWLRSNKQNNPKQLEAFETFLEHEHVLGRRIVACGMKIVEALKPLKPGQRIPEHVRQAMGIQEYLHTYFADQVHLQAEEAIIPLAVTRGMDPRHGAWVLRQHEQARAYWKATSIAWERLLSGDEDDYFVAIQDYWRATEAFGLMFTQHAEREDNGLYPEMARYFSKDDDDQIMKIITHVGPVDVTPYVRLVEDMEQLLGIPAPR